MTKEEALANIRIAIYEYCKAASHLSHKAKGQ
jgi:hypothetical protein